MTDQEERFQRKLAHLKAASEALEMVVKEVQACHAEVERIDLYAGWFAEKIFLPIGRVRRVLDEEVDFLENGDRRINALSR